LRRQALDALACLTEFYARRRQYALAQRYALRQLALEPWRESAHRQLIRILALSRERSQQALRLAQGLGARREQGYALTNLGHALTGLGRLPEAATAYQQAIDVRREMGVRSRMIEPLAGRARVAIAQGDTSSVLAHVAEILAYLETGSLAGTDAPFRVYLTCYRVLQAHHDIRAPGILQLAHKRLHALAATIADERLRRLFLEHVPSHRELIRAFHQQSSAGGT
jgi:tetratricopeptide (TPR) repeat protein